MCVGVHIINSPTGRTCSYITENENENYVPEKWHTPKRKVRSIHIGAREKAFSSKANLIRIFDDFVLIFHSSAPRTAFFRLFNGKINLRLCFRRKHENWLRSRLLLWCEWRFIRFNYDYIIRRMSTREDINIMKKPNANSSKLLCNLVSHRAERVDSEAPSD